MQGTEKQIQFASNIISAMVATSPAAFEPMEQPTEETGDEAGLRIRHNQIGRAWAKESKAIRAAGDVLSTIEAGDIEKADQMMQEFDADDRREYMEKVAACFISGSLDAGQVIEKFKTIYYRLQERTS